MTAPSRAKFQPTALHNITQTLTFLVPGGRVELPWCRHRRILSPLRLPFRHPGTEARRKVYTDRTSHCQFRPEGSHQLPFERKLVLESMESTEECIYGAGSVHTVRKCGRGNRWAIVFREARNRDQEKHLRGVLG